jgi:FkbM family methyltransferase
MSLDPFRNRKSPGPNLLTPLTQPYSAMYGSDNIAARYCGFKTPPCAPRGLWQHAWIPSKQPLVQADQVFGVTMSHLQSESYWVATKRLEEYLRGQGFLNARAIGMPILYVPTPSIARRGGTLLVMPAHAMDTTWHDWPTQAYVDAIAALRPHFREIVVCVNASCLANGRWAPAFQAADFKVVRGADGSDPWTLDHLARLFTEFEFVTTNGHGSLLAYAACFGAKVSIFGPYVDYTAKSLFTAPFYLDNPQLAEIAATNCSWETVHHRHPELFCHPAEAVERRDWGRSELGSENRASPRELRELFGWTPARRVGARLSIRGLKAILPRRIKLATQVIMSAPFRKQFADRNPLGCLKLAVTILRSSPLHREIEERDRLGRMPRYVRGRTPLFGREIEFIDACSYLVMHDDLFKRGIYRFRAQNEPPLIIDGGANIGLSVLYFKCLYPNSNVIAFEADPAISDVLRRNCATYELEGVEIVPKAIWKCETVLPFQQEGSMSGRIPPTPHDPQTVSVPACRLADYLQQPVDLLKLDIEGAETEVLLDCAPHLKNVANLFVEHHSFLGKTQDLHVLINLLHDAGFRVFVEPAIPVRHPLLARAIIAGMDVQVNVFAFRA